MSFRNFGHESFPSHFSLVNSPNEFPGIVSFGCIFSRDLKFFLIFFEDSISVFLYFNFFHRNSVYCQGVKRRDETTFPTLTCARRLKCE